MEGSLLMSKDKKGRRWDGRSRISTQQYKDNYDEIFKKNKKNKKSNDGTPTEPGVSTNIQLNAEIVNGTCPHCSHPTVFVCLWTNSIYRCMTCGHDVEQKVNGKISYIPHVVDKDKFKYAMKVDTNG